MKKLLLFSFLFASLCGSAQQPSFSIGGERPNSATDNPDASSFRIGTVNYVLFQRFSASQGMLLHLEGFSDPNDAFFCSEDIATPHLPNEVAIFEGFLALNDKMLLLRAVFNKEAKKYALFAHNVNAKGIVEAEGKEILSIAAEKAMNSGNYTVKASADGKSFVVFSEYPFVKESKEKFAVTVFDSGLNQLWTKELELSYDARKGPVNNPMLSNSGIVYVVKKIAEPKVPEYYTVYQIAEKGARVKEAVVTLDGPRKVVTYGAAIDEATGDLAVTGYYTEDGKVVFGGTNYNGTFIQWVNGANGEVKARTASPFDKVRSNLNVVDVRFLKGNVFMTGEESIENRLATSQTDTRGFPIYNQEFINNDIIVSSFDASGKLITNTTLSKENRSIEDGGFGNSVSVTTVGEQLMLVYNAHQYKYDGQEHKVVGPALANVKIPVIQFMGADGSKGRTFAMIDTNVGGTRSGTVYLLPSITSSITDKDFFFLSRAMGNTLRPVRLKLP